MYANIQLIKQGNLIVFAQWLSNLSFIHENDSWHEVAEQLKDIILVTEDSAKRKQKICQQFLLKSNKTLSRHCTVKNGVIYCGSVRSSRNSQSKNWQSRQRGFKFAPIVLEQNADQRNAACMALDRHITVYFIKLTPRIRSHDKSPLSNVMSALAAGGMTESLPIIQISLLSGTNWTTTWARSDSDQQNQSWMRA